MLLLQTGINLLSLFPFCCEFSLRFFVNEEAKKTYTIFFSPEDHHQLSKPPEFYIQNF